MKTKSIAILLAAIIMALLVCCSAGSAALPMVPSNETSALSVEITASAVGKLTSNTDLEFTQGNGNLIDNPPLAAGEGQSTLGYVEDTVATSGSIYYTKNLYLDTSSQTQASDNLLVVREIDYDNDGDGNGAGVLYSTEAVFIDACTNASESSAGTGCCQWPTDTPEVVPASCISVISGSEVILKEGSVTSVSSANTVNEDVNAGVQLSYEVSVDGSGQTGNKTAEGKATVYTEALIMEGSGNATNMTTNVEYKESVTVDGLIEIAMKTGYSSP
jgi:hypothetical protein